MAIIATSLDDRGLWLAGSIVVVRAKDGSNDFALGKGTREGEYIGRVLLR